nr:hypothetical protein K-LCC10_0068 [Kaumoebavirus]
MSLLLKIAIAVVVILIVAYLAWTFVIRPKLIERKRQQETPPMGTSSSTASAPPPAAYSLDTTLRKTAKSGTWISNDKDTYVLSDAGANWQLRYYFSNGGAISVLIPQQENDTSVKFSDFPYKFGKESGTLTYESPTALTFLSDSGVKLDLTKR